MTFNKETSRYELSISEMGNVYTALWSAEQHYADLIKVAPKDCDLSGVYEIAAKLMAMREEYEAIDKEMFNL